jgi:Protein of unknown function (DUF3326)
VVIPATACGGSAILSLSQSAQIITVQDNQTRLDVTAEALGVSAIAVQSYLEALGVLVAHRAGISPAALRAHISSMREL